MKVQIYHGTPHIFCEEIDSFHIRETWLNSAHLYFSYSTLEYQPESKQSTIVTACEINMHMNKFH